MNQPLIITCAITGAELTKNQCPVLPVTPLEQAMAAEEAVMAGASIIHLHVRDQKGEPTQSCDRFKEVMDLIKARVPQAILQISTGGAVGEAFESRLAPLKLKPEMASLNMGSLNFGEELFVNLPKEILALHEAMQKNNILPECEIYDAGMLEYTLKLIQKNILKPPHHLQFVLGVQYGMSGDLKNLMHFLSVLEAARLSDIHWSVAGVGRAQLPLAVQAILLGGHVRVGLEDNIYYHKGERAESNAQLVKRVVRLAEELGRPVATPLEARKIMGLRD